VPTAEAFLNHPDPLTSETARGYAGGSFLMDNGDGLKWYGVGKRALVPLGSGLTGERLHVPRSLNKHLSRFEVAIDLDFAGVLAGCRDRPKDQTWISDELAEIYLHLHHTGLAHSFEAHQGGKLAGGVLGLVLGGAFIGETMFHSVTHASKVALVQLSRHLSAQGFVLLDAQIQNPHLARFGTYEIGGGEYRKLLKEALGADVELLS
jgi:leucyl/phenylalanyl-tRNA---protein transferase